MPRDEIPCEQRLASPVDDVGALAVDVGRLKIPQSHSAPELGWRLRPGDPRRRQMHWLDRQIRHDQAMALLREVERLRTLAAHKDTIIAKLVGVMS